VLYQTHLRQRLLHRTNLAHRNI